MCTVHGHHNKRHHGSGRKCIHAYARAHVLVHPRRFLRELVRGGGAVSSEYLIITHSLGSTQSMRQLDFISCLHQAGPPPGPQPSQKRCPPPHPAFQAHGAQIRLPGLVDHTHPAFLSTAPRNVPPGQKGPPRPLKLRFALTEALRPAFPWSAMISLSELLWLPW